MVRSRIPSLRFRWFLTFALLMGLLQAWLMAQSSTGPAAAPKTTLDEVSEKLSCRCGCNLVLNRCNHVQCGSAIPMRERITREIAQGKNRDEIIAGFVREMGEEVLAVPPTSGFNWNAWIMPFAMLAAGTVLVIVVLKVMMRRRPVGIPAASPAGAGGPSSTAETLASSKKLDDRIEMELKEFGDS
ncbi:MAG: cytochrome c-type biogenesis protein CcmH [Terriglobia bacterium]